MDCPRARQYLQQKLDVRMYVAEVFMCTKL
jgi:hypothetical protein